MSKKEKQIEEIYEMLKTYKGPNEQVLTWAVRYRNGNFVMDDFSYNYIRRNKDYASIEINRTFKLTDDYSQQLQEKYNLDIFPHVILIHKLLGEMSSSYHVLFQYRKSVPPKYGYISKRGVIGKLIQIDPNSIVVDFDKYDRHTMALDEPFALREHQKYGVKFLLANKHCICADSMGTGKMQSVYTPIPTPDGDRLMGDLHVGDRVYGSDGKAHNVTGVYPHKCKQLYKIRFTDGRVTDCGLDHLWIVQDKENNNNTEVLSFSDILERGIYCRDGSTRFKVPIAAAVDSRGDVPLESCYRLGCFIASDPLPHRGEDAYEDDVAKRYFFKYKDINAIRPRVIPEEVFSGTIEERKEVLAGLMDSIGNVDERAGGSSIIINDNPELVTGIKRLIYSLGGMAKEEIFHKRATIRLTTPFNPFCNKEDNGFIPYDAPLYNDIVEWWMWSKSDAVCISVDSDDHSYLTEDYIVTHNTITSIVAGLETGPGKILVITTAALKTNWYSECCRYVSPDTIGISNGSDLNPGSRFTIANYDIMARFYQIAEEVEYEDRVFVSEDGKEEHYAAPKMVKDSSGKKVFKMKKSRKKELIEKAISESPLFQEDYNCVIIDEAQKLSNRTSGRYKVIEDYLKRAALEYIFLLTGTPLTNNPMNLYNILNLIGADICKDYNYYTERYCGAKKIEKHDGSSFIKYGKPQNLNELMNNIKDIYIRRMPEDVGTMVKKTVEKRIYDLTPEQKVTYDGLWDAYTASKDGKQMNIEGFESYFDNSSDDDKYRQLVEGTLVRKYLADIMVEHTIDIVDTLLEEGEKVIIACNFQSEVDALKKHYGKKGVTFTGKMTSKARDKAKDAFINDPKVTVFIANIVAAGVGLNLQVSRYVIFNSYSWSAADNKQMQDRVYRLTQTRDVTCVYQLFNDSVSHDMFEKVIYKELLANTIVKSEKEK